jgi:hypothetical protein
MKTATKSTVQKTQVPKGMTLGEYRLSIAAKNPLKIAEKGRNIWNIKPYKD